MNYSENNECIFPLLLFIARGSKIDIKTYLFAIEAPYLFTRYSG